MGKTDVKELKGLRNHDFYPGHYFTEALAFDAKSGGFDGKVIKDLKKIVGERTLQLKNSKHPDSNERIEIAKEWYKSLGFYEVNGDSNQLGKFISKGKELNLEIEKIIPFQGDGQLWIIIDPVDTFKDVPDKEDVASELDQKQAVHFHQGQVQVSQNQKKVVISWKETINGIFDSDHCSAEWLLIHQGDRIIVLERGRWQESEGYLEVDCWQLFDVNSEMGYKVVHAHLSAKALPIYSAESFVDNLEKNAHKKAAEVTKSLRDTVRESIEIIANEILRNHKKNKLSCLLDYDLSLPEQRDAASREIFEQSLRYVYRMLFMLFTESQDQKKSALPVGSRPYQMGYAIEKLRELESIPLVDGSGNFIQKTLEQAFSIYFYGYNNEHDYENDSHTNTNQIKTNALGFSFPKIGTNLFNIEKTPIFKEAKLTDAKMQEVIRKISLAKTVSGKKTRTYRVHYAGLGINQLGAVYEGLLSLKPEILAENIVLLKKDKKEPAHRYISFDHKDEFSDSLLQYDENNNLVTRNTGEFILSPVGLERKFSASYYTPEVLTRFLAKESVDSLLKDDASLEKMQNLKICEPAMGSGAFLNAVVDEIAPKMAKFYRKDAHDMYQSYCRECEKKGKPVEKESAPAVEDLQYYTLKAKDHLMRNCVYGVDLNGTAVELAKISLWLNCLHKDGNLPFLQSKLKQGNSLVGAWLNKFHIEGTNLQHFLVPPSDALKTHLEGTILGKKESPFIESKEEKHRLKGLQQDWKNIVKNKVTKNKIDNLSHKINQLYQTHLTAKTALQENLDHAETNLEKSEIYQKYLQSNHAYNQLRLIMDYWCSIWFWPIEEISSLPTSEEYIQALEWITDNQVLYNYTSKDDLSSESGISQLNIVKDIACIQNFFHWDLEYVEIFSNGGFDLVLGNPPWAPVRWEEADFFEYYKPGIHAVKMDSKQKNLAYSQFLEKNETLIPLYKSAQIKSNGLGCFLKNSSTYPFKDKSQTNTYRYFYQRFLSLCKPEGIYSIIAQDGIVNDKGCLKIRPNFYNEAEKIFRFVNELKLFEDIGNLTFYLVGIFKRAKKELNFNLIDNLYHPDTIEKCQLESIMAPYVGMKDSMGKFELRGHPKRIAQINHEVLKKLSSFEAGSNPLEVKLPIIHGQIELEILTKLAAHDLKMKDTTWGYWRRFDESGAPKANLITRAPGPSNSLAHAVMTGPNVFVGNPAYQSPNPGCKNHRDFSKIVLTQTPDDFFPDTVYQATEKGLKSKEYLGPTPWGTNSCDEYRITGRGLQVGTTGSRTLSTAIIPPKVGHIYSLFSMSFPNLKDLLKCSGLFNSIIFDFLTRNTCGGSVTTQTFKIFPALNEAQKNNKLTFALMGRTLRLSSISSHYEDLWKNAFHNSFKIFEIQSPYSPDLPYSQLKPTWERNSCIRDEKQREQALCEIDAIVAILFDFEKETLLNLYRSQFGVLQKNLQDLPDQKPRSDKYHFPRYKQMSDAYDQFVKLMNKEEDIENNDKPITKAS